MDYDIRVIPHNAQRYDTVGDYYMKRDNLVNMRISNFETVPDITMQQAADAEFCVMIHELIEAHLCRKAGISLEDIDAWDLKFEMERQRGLHLDAEEPGNHPDAPYHAEHKIAENIEKQLAMILNLDWKYYSDAVDYHFRQIPAPEFQILEPIAFIPENIEKIAKALGDARDAALEATGAKMLQEHPAAGALTESGIRMMTEQAGKRYE